MIETDVSKVHELKQKFYCTQTRIAQEHIPVVVVFFSYMYVCDAVALALENRHKETSV